MMELGSNGGDNAWKRNEDVMMMGNNRVGPATGWALAINKRRHATSWVLIAMIRVLVEVIHA